MAQSLLNIAYGIGITLKMDPGTLDRELGIYARIPDEVDLLVSRLDKLLVTRKNVKNEGVEDFE